MTDSRSEIVALTALFDNRRPTPAEVDSWVVRRSSESFAQAAADRFGL